MRNSSLDKGCTWMVRSAREGVAILPTADRVWIGYVTSLRSSPRNPGHWRIPYILSSSRKRAVFPVPDPDRIAGDQILGVPQFPPLDSLRSMKSTEQSGCSFRIASAVGQNVALPTRRCPTSFDKLLAHIRLNRVLVPGPGDSRVYLQDRLLVTGKHCLLRWTYYGNSGELSIVMDGLLRQGASSSSCSQRASL